MPFPDPSTIALPVPRNCPLERLVSIGRPIVRGEVDSPYVKDLALRGFSYRTGISTSPRTIGRPIETGLSSGQFPRTGSAIVDGSGNGILDNHLNDI
jgi:hypothetical protein